MTDRTVGYTVQLKDDGSVATASRIELAMRKADTAAGTFSETLIKSKTQIREFRRAGSELIDIAQRLGIPFADAAVAVGDFAQTSGQIALFSRSVVDLTPKAIAAASAALGLGAAETVAGTAAAAATTEVAALAAAEGVASVGALALAAAWAPFLAIAAAGAVAIGALTVVNEQIKNSALDAAIAEQEHARAMGLAGTAAQQERAAIAEVTGAYTTGATSAAQYSQKLAEIETRFKSEIAIQNAAVTGARTAAAAFATLADSGGDLVAVLNKLTAGSKKNSTAVEQGTDAAEKNEAQTRAFAAAQEDARLRLYGEAGGAISAALALEGLGGASNSAAAGADANAGALSKEAAWLDNVAFKASVASRNLAAMGHVQDASNAATRNRLRGLGEDPGAGVSGSLQYGGPQVVPYEQDLSPFVPFVYPKGPKGRSGGTSDADKAAREEAAAIAAAYAADKQAADSYYDAVHDKNQATIDNAHKLAAANIDASHKAAQAAIEDAHKVANEQIQSARKAVDGQLSEQLRLNAAPVTAAEKALQATMDAQRLRDLQEGAASAGADPKAIRSAQESLANFLAQQQIDAMKDQQALNDQAAHDAADAANALLDTQQKTEDETYQQHKDDEDATYAARQATEDATYAARQAKEDARYELQKKIADDQIDAMSKSTKATEHLAQVQELAFLGHQLDLAGKDDPSRAMAVYEYNKFAKANPDLGAVPRHATGLGFVPHDNYPAFLDRGERVVPAGQWRGGGGDIHVHPGAIVIQGAGRSADAIAAETLLKLRRELSRQGMSLG